MEQLRLVKEFLGIEDETEAKAWCLFVEMLRAMSDAEVGLVSRRDADNARRRFERFLMRHNLQMLSDEDGLEPGEFAILRTSDEKWQEESEPAEEKEEKEEKRESAIGVVNSMDILLLANHEDVCEALIAEDVRSVEGFPESIVRFFSAPEVHERLKEWVVERDSEKGERLLKAVLEEIPDEIHAHFMLARKYEQDGRMDDAESEYRRFLRIRDDGIVWANYGWLLERMGRYDEALDAFEHAFSCIQEEFSEDVGEELAEELRRSKSRVSRMMKLRGEDARKAREYQRAVWLINEIREYAEKHFSSDIEIARREFIEAQGEEEEMSDEDEMEFMNWFLFARRLPDGRTPAIVFADERGLDNETREKLIALGSPVNGIFEVMSYEPDAFRIRVRNLLNDEEYELMADIEGIEIGQTFSGNIYPWGDIYLSGGALRIHSPELSEEIRNVVENFRENDASAEKKEREEVHKAFVSFFGSWEVVFDTREACENAINKFLDWFIFERETEIGKTIAEIYREEHGEEMKRERFKIPQSFEHASGIGVLSDAEEGIFLVQDYGILKHVIERGGVSTENIQSIQDTFKISRDELFSKLRTLFVEMEDFALRNLLQTHKQNVIRVINEVFSAEIPENADVNDVLLFMKRVREQG